VTLSGSSDLEAIYERFRARASAVSAEVHRVATPAACLAFVMDTLRQEGVADASGAYAVWAECPLLHRIDGFDPSALAAQLPGLHFEVTRELAAAAKVGITQAEYAVAETGTLLQDSTHPQQRLASSLPSIHIALIHTANLRATLAEGLQAFDPRRARYLAAITGPSRTADIERVLTIGVHGPVRLIIVFFDSPEEASL
jgi:L-lactate dehydrogenase complex protein LldG